MESIERREAKSGKVSYADPVVLFESSKTRVVFVPFFIPHSDHTELAVKITTYKKPTDPDSWMVIEDKSISLKEGGARNLLEALRTHLAVSGEDADGRYLVIPVSGEVPDIGSHDPAKVATALTALLAKPQVAAHLADADLDEGLVVALAGAIRVKEMQEAVAALRTHLDEGEAAESVYQDWCEKHTWAFGNAYVVRDSVRTISPGDKLDLLLPTVLSGHRDLVELKRPDMNVLHYDDAHKNFYFSADVSRAIGQCHRYLDVLHEEAAKGLRDAPEIVAYHPRAILVIGRSQGWPPEKLKALHGLNRRLHGITVMTYDQLLSQGERLIATLVAERARPEESVAEEATRAVADARGGDRHRKRRPTGRH